MTHLHPFPIQNFPAHCNSLQRVGVDPGFIMYTNNHAGSHHPVARPLSTAQLEPALAYIRTPSDENFRHLVEVGGLLDTEWDRSTNHWQIIDFVGWETLHTAFCRLHHKSMQELAEMGGAEMDFDEQL
jgi:hypothetical protein